jgi:uncharacterized glyoxalase superfamily protein PhnB
MTAKDAALRAPSPTVWPTVHFADADAGMRMLTDLLGFVVTALHRDESGEVVHAEARWPDGGGVMFGTDRKTGPWGELGPQGVYVAAAQAATVDAIWDRVQAAVDQDRVTVVDPLAEADYGSHQLTVRDADGNLWCVGTYLGE